MVQVRDLAELRARDLWSEVKDEDEWLGEIKGLSVLESAMEEAAHLRGTLRAPAVRQAQARRRGLAL